jgi:hypothetical protein
VTTASRLLRVRGEIMISETFFIHLFLFNRIERNTRVAKWNFHNKRGLNRGLWGLVLFFNFKFKLRLSYTCDINRHSRLMQHTQVAPLSRRGGRHKPIRESRFCDRPDGLTPISVLL